MPSNPVYCVHLGKYTQFSPSGAGPQSFPFQKAGVIHLACHGHTVPHQLCSLAATCTIHGTLKLLYSYHSVGQGWGWGSHVWCSVVPLSSVPHRLQLRALHCTPSPGPAWPQVSDTCTSGWRQWCQARQEHQATRPAHTHTHTVSFVLSFNQTILESIKWQAWALLVSSSLYPNTYWCSCQGSSVPTTPPLYRFHLVDLEALDSHTHRRVSLQSPGSW